MAGFPGSDIKGQYTQTRLSVTNNSSSETEHKFQKGVKAFMVICNEFEIVRVSWASGEVDDSSGVWFLLYPREPYSEENLYLTDDNRRSLWMNAPDAAASVIVYILEWR